MTHILIFGGCGFIGSNLAVALSKSGSKVTCFDNLPRRGSEILLDRVLAHQCEFIHGDIRNPEDIAKLQSIYDIVIDCSAEPSVLVGSQGEDARYMINNNLMGSVNCFEFCRKEKTPIIFLSTSRIYPYDAINALNFREESTRFQYGDDDDVMGVSAQGVSAEFSLAGYRSLYGAAKLSSEYLLREYCQNFGIPAIINRCGVIAGPWQLGKVDQGVFTHWLASHYFKKTLKYIGFGGKGKQVRDLLHIDDLTSLLQKQIQVIDGYKGDIFNVGGSTISNLSLMEATGICEKITGNSVEIRPVKDDRPADVLWYITDNGETLSEFGWQPQKSAREILQDIYKWLAANEALFVNLMGK